MAGQIETPPQGPFFVFPNECMMCGAPEMAAPDLMDHIVGEAGYEHCHFARQPETLGEITHAIDAVSVSCCGAVVYLGDDPDILSAIADRRHTQSLVWHRETHIPVQFGRTFRFLNPAVRWSLMVTGGLLFAFCILTAVFYNHVTAALGYWLYGLGGLGWGLWGYAKARG